MSQLAQNNALLGTPETSGVLNCLLTFSTGRGVADRFFATPPVGKRRASYRRHFATRLEHGVARLGTHDKGTDKRDGLGVNSAFLNQRAWLMRWSDRDGSVELAQAVLDQTASSVTVPRRDRGLALRTLAWQSRWRGALSEAEELCHRAMARLRGEDAQDAMADCHTILGVIANTRGDRTTARDHVTEGFACLTADSAVETRIDLLANLANIERYSGRFDLAHAILTDARGLATGQDLARVEQTFARAALRDGNPQQCLDHAQVALDLAEAHGNRIIQPYALEIRGAALVDVGQAGDALTALEQGLTLAREDRDRRAECQLLHEVCRVHMAQQRYEEGLSLAQGGQQVATELGCTVLETRFLERVAFFQDRLGQTEAALDSFRTLALRRGPL